MAQTAPKWECKVEMMTKRSDIALAACCRPLRDVCCEWLSPGEFNRCAECIFASEWQALCTLRHCLRASRAARGGALSPAALRLLRYPEWSPLRRQGEPPRPRLVSSLQQFLHCCFVTSKSSRSYAHNVRAAAVKGVGGATSLEKKEDKNNKRLSTNKQHQQRFPSFYARRNHHRCAGGHPNALAAPPPAPPPIL